MTWGAVAGAAVSVVGGAIASDSAGSAAGSQSQASQQASAQQAMAAAQMRQDLSPWVGTGNAANSALSRYLGLGLGTTGTVNGLQSGLTRDQVRQQLISQYTKTVPSASAQAATNAFVPTNTSMASNGDLNYAYGAQPNSPSQFPSGSMGDGQSMGGYSPNTGPQTMDQVDDAGLNAAIDKYYADQSAQEEALKGQPGYGSLLTPFHNGAEFSFTGKDLASDPGYQFGLDQGTQGINRGQAARGNFLSGAGMKELDRYNQDYAGTKFNDAFNRASGTWNTNLNAYTGNQQRIYNFLTGVSTLGQNSAAQVGTNNQQVANSIAGNTLASGNAQAAGTIASGNALQSGLNGAANSINSVGGWNNLLGKPSNNTSGYGADVNIGTQSYTPDAGSYFYGST